MRACVVVFLLPVTQGCERTPAILYPDHPTGLAVAALADTTFAWETRQSEHFRIHFQSGSYAADHTDEFVKDAEQARANGLRVLGERRFIPRIDVFHLKSRDDVKRLTGVPVRGWADPESRTVLLVRSSSSNQGERHEVAHVLSHGLWGHSRDWEATGWMSEAVATYAGGPCSGHSIDEIVAYADRQEELIPLDSLARKFRAYNDLMAYLQAGSFIGYIQEMYGVSPVRGLWNQAFEQIETILGKTPAAIDTEWRNHLRSWYPHPQVAWATLKKNGCQ